MEENEHEIDRGLRLAKALGIEMDDDQPSFYVSDEDREFAEHFLARHGVTDRDMIVAVQVDTWHVQSWKRWPVERLATVCDRLIDECGAKIIAFGSPDYKHDLDDVVRNMRYDPIVALGHTTIKQSAALMRRCNFAICNDSGLMHMSAAMGTPVIAIYGPTDYRRTSPQRYGQQHVVIRKELPCSPCFRMDGDDKVRCCPNRICLERITSDDVFYVAKQLIEYLSEAKA